MRTLRMFAWAVVPTVAVLIAAVGLGGVSSAANPPRPGPTQSSAPTPAYGTVARLSRLHHVATREVQLGRLAEVSGNRPETRAYGTRLIADFQGLDDRIVALAEELGVDSARLAPIHAGGNTAALSREAEDLTGLGTARGDAFDRQFWVIVAQDQLAASDMLLPVAGADPRLEPLVADLGRQLEASSRRALVAAEPVATPSRAAVQPPPVPALDVPPAPVTAPVLPPPERPPVPRAWAPPPPPR